MDVLLNISGLFMKLCLRGHGQRDCRRPPDFFRFIIAVSLAALVLLPAASATTVYVLNATAMEQFKDGISYAGDDDLVIEIAEDVAIGSTGTAGIVSAAPLTIRSPAGRTLSISVDNDSEKLYGITAPSVTLVSGNLAITVKGENDPKSGNAFGIHAGSGNVTIAGGSVTTDVATTGHKNKGIYASRFVIVSGGRLDLDERGGSNTFGLDGGDVDTGNPDGGIAITGGTVTVSSGGASARNFGIDSKFGTVRISGDPVIVVSEDESGKSQNFAYNANITTISGNNAVVFTAEAGNYTLRSDGILAQDASLPAGGTFEIPAGRTLALAGGIHLTKPAGTVILSGDGFGSFGYDASRTDPGTGAVIYTGAEPTQVPSQAPTQKSPLPVAAVIAGLALAAVVVRRE